MEDTADISSLFFHYDTWKSLFKHFFLKLGLWLKFPKVGMCALASCIRWLITLLCYESRHWWAQWVPNLDIINTQDYYVQHAGRSWKPCNPMYEQKSEIKISKKNTQKKLLLGSQSLSLRMGVGTWRAKRNSDFKIWKKHTHQTREGRRAINKTLYHRKNNSVNKSIYWRNMRLMHLLQMGSALKRNDSAIVLQGFIFGKREGRVPPRTLGPWGGGGGSPCRMSIEMPMSHVAPKNLNVAYWIQEMEHDMSFKFSCQKSPCRILILINVHVSMPNWRVDCHIIVSFIRCQLGKIWPIKGEAVWGVSRGYQRPTMWGNVTIWPLNL